MSYKCTVNVDVMLFFYRNKIPLNLFRDEIECLHRMGQGLEESAAPQECEIDFVVVKTVVRE